MTSERKEEVTYTLQSFISHSLEDLCIFQQVKAWARLQNTRKHLQEHWNLSFSGTQGCHRYTPHTTICYCKRARWPPLSALLRVQNATPCLLHTQIRARGPHRPRNVAESAWTPYGSFCLCLRSTNSQAQAVHVSRLAGGTQMGSVWCKIG
ncbi:hypothetical protein R3I93_004204 [Phoxinus phoxinus]|uniref:Uncharacterized protein n=1 Tax=Phoxinus phoxinus TaxID=58324 RepID=A0AAN9HG68_9TELE